jgi:hypothetical protein
MMIDLRDRPRLLLELLVAEVLARPGQGPLARPVWSGSPRARAEAPAASPLPDERQDP